MSTTLFYKDLVGDGKVGIGSTATPTANLQVMGNIYASNSLTTTNLFANTLSVANASATGSVTASTFYGVLAGSNTISSSNLLVASGLPASIVQGSNVVVFSNVAGGSNIMVMNSLGRVGFGTTSPATALDVYTGTMNAAAVTASSATLTSLGVLTGNITTANIVSLNVTGDANIAQNLRVLSNLYTNNLIMGSNLSTDTGYGNVYVSANLVVNGNVFSLNSSGSGSGTSQGISYILAGNYTLGVAFATGTAGPSMNAYHINMSSFTAETSASVTAFSAASGMLKFATAGLYQVQMVLVGDQPLVKVGVGSASVGSFPPGSTATSGYLYVYNVTAGSSPSTVITIPLNITDISKWYYLDAFFSTAAGDPTLLYPTAPPGGSSAGSNYGTFIQVSPFGNYLSSATGIASALLTNCSSSSNLSGVYSSNAYRIAMTSSNGWTVNGTSTSLAITTNGNFQVNQTGIYEVNMCLNTVGNTPVQFQIGSLATDALSPAATPADYLYTYAPMYTQDPTTVIQLPLNITNISNVYFIECSFPGTVTGNVALTQTSTFVSIKPIGGYLNTGTNPWIQQGSFVYYSNGSVGIGTASPATALDVYTGTINAAAITATSGNIATMNVGYLTVNSAVVYGTSTLNVYGTSNLTNVTVTGTITASSNISGVTINTNNLLIAGAAGTASQVLQATGTGAGIQWGTVSALSGLTTNAVLYATSATTASTTGTAANFYWDNATARLGLGTASPATALDVYTGTMNAATVVATTHYGVLAGSNTVAASTVSATSLYGVLAGSNTVAASTVSATSLVGTHYGVLAGSNTVAASTVSATTLTGAGSGITGLDMGNAGSGTLAVARGGTGTTTTQLAMNALAGAVTNAQYLRGNGTNVVMAAISSSDVPTLNQNTSGTAAGLTGTPNITVGTVGASTVTGSADATFNSVKVGMGTGSVATNTAVGASALNANTTGANNTAVGQGAMQNTTTGIDNTAVGANAMQANTSGQLNTAVGSSAMAANTDGAYNTAVGKGAMGNNTTGSYNTALGMQAMQSNTTGINNTAVGYQAMTTNTGGHGNTAVGKYAMTANTTGQNNTAVGYGAMTLNTKGQRNTAVGKEAMFANMTGTDNTAVGESAMYQNTTGTDNTAVGENAMYDNTYGIQNTALGAYAGSLDQNGDPAEFFNNSTCLGYGSSVSGSNQVQCGNSSTSFYAYGAYNNRSDIRDKADVRETVVGLDFINKVQAVDFRWNYRRDYFEKVEEDVTDPETQVVTKVRKLVPIPNDGSKKRTRFHQGVIAQQVKEVMDELGVDFAGYQDHTVKGGCDVLTIGYTEFIGPLIKAVQELSAENTTLKQSLISATENISSLKTRLDSLETRLAAAGF